MKFPADWTTNQILRKIPSIFLKINKNIIFSIDSTTSVPAYGKVNEPKLQAQTKKPNKPIDAIAQVIAEKPKIGLAEKV
jgi:hypothetical protein